MLNIKCSICNIIYKNLESSGFRVDPRELCILFVEESNLIYSDLHIAFYLLNRILIAASRIPQSHSLIKSNL